MTQSFLSNEKFIANFHQKENISKIIYINNLSIKEFFFLNHFETGIFPHLNRISLDILKRI